MLQRIRLGNLHQLLPGHAVDPEFSGSQIVTELQHSPGIFPGLAQIFFGLLVNFVLGGGLAGGFLLFLIHLREG